MKTQLVAAGLWLLAAAPALAAEEQVMLKDAPGRDVVAGNCAACHSLDYIRINSPFQTRAVWTAEVNKMIHMFGAPISEADAATILNYLTTNYGAQK